MKQAEHLPRVKHLRRQKCSTWDNHPAGVPSRLRLSCEDRNPSVLAPLLWLS